MGGPFEGEQSVDNVAWHRGRAPLSRLSGEAQRFGGTRRSQTASRIRCFLLGFPLEVVYLSPYGPELSRAEDTQIGEDQ